MNNTPPFHQVRTPEGYEGWQWMNGPIFLYDKNNPTDSADAQLLAIRWAEEMTKLRQLRLEIQQRAERVKKKGPVILNFEEEKAKRDSHFENETR